MIEGEFTKSTDEYILQLVDLKEKQDYYTCVGRGKDDNDYDYILHKLFEFVNRGN